MKKVLIITYYWPPSGGAGVQRWLKFSKYLPLHGWEPVILTVDPEYATYPALDESLMDEVPASVRIYRTRATDWFRLYSKDKSKVPSAGFASNNDISFRGKLMRFIRGNFFIPDPRRGWNRFAYKKACEIINNEGIKHVITTSPPHSTQLIGLRLKKKFPGISWICDLRDTWTDIYYYKLFYPTFISKAIDSAYEKSVLRNADNVITVGNNLAEVFSSKASGLEDKIQTIPNGYDVDDFKDIIPAIPPRFTITYVGTLSESYPIKPVLNALASLESDGKDFLLRFVGNIPESIRAEIRMALNPEHSEFIPYSKHQLAISLMASSSLLLLLIPETEKNSAITPGKVFEYIATGKEVLYIGPLNGDAAFHLKKCGSKGIFDGANPEQIRDFISVAMQAGQSADWLSFPEYSRENLTGEISKVLETGSKAFIAGGQHPK